MNNVFKAITYPAYLIGHIQVVLITKAILLAFKGILKLISFKKK